MSNRYAAEFEDELEFEQEGECELEGECEGEWEDETEGEEFLGALRRAGSWLATPGSMQRRVALAAARSALRRGATAAGGWLGGRVGSPGLGTQLGGLVGDSLGAALPAQEYEVEFEDEMLAPAPRAIVVPTMAHLSSMAARARNPAEAEAFLGALLPLAARAIPRIAPIAARALPQLARGVARVGQTLLRSPATRPLLRAAPRIVTGTMRSLAGQIAAGRPLTAQGAVRTLARQTYNTLARPAALQSAIRATRAQDRNYHRQSGGRPCRCGR